MTGIWRYKCQILNICLFWLLVGNLVFTSIKNIIIFIIAHRHNNLKQCLRSHSVIYLLSSKLWETFCSGLVFHVFLHYVTCAAFYRVYLFVRRGSIPMPFVSSRWYQLGANRSHKYLMDSHTSMFFQCYCRTSKNQIHSIDQLSIKIRELFETKKAFLTKRNFLSLFQ